MSLPLFVLTASVAVAQPPQAAPTQPNPLARPIPEAQWPAHVRRDAPTDAVIQRIWDEGMTRSQVMRLGQVLLDSLGQRLSGSPQIDAAQDWLVRTYASWGVTARREQYGTWPGWQKGVAHVDLVAPRVRSLEAQPLAWSPGTGGRWLEGAVVAWPADVTTPEQFDAWLPTVRGKFFLLSAPRLSCRSPQQWQEFGTPEETQRVNAEQTALQTAWNQANVAMNGGRNVWQKLRDAGALGVFSFQFSNYPGIAKIFGSPNQTVPAFAVGCEDYGLLYRLARANQGPVVRAFTDSELLGDRAVFNVIAEIKGSEKPDEYVMFSAHFDSWAASSGATDNGTGTLAMLEALRILRQVYPRPKRTLLVGHWGGEEQGLIGSRAFTEDHPEVVAGLQALFNQDNGTGRISSMSAGPFPGAAKRLERYFFQIPNQLTSQIRWTPTSGQGTGGTDHVSFVCHKAPGFGTGALSWDYSLTTWHTDRDTYDKVVESDLKHNATLLAMLAYLASEDPERMPRDILDPLPRNPQTGQPAQWVPCAKANRGAAGPVR
jgi:hypothetical protein